MPLISLEKPLKSEDFSFYMRQQVKHIPLVVKASSYVSPQNLSRLMPKGSRILLENTLEHCDHRFSIVAYNSKQHSVSIDQSFNLKIDGKIIEYSSLQDSLGQLDRLFKKQSEFRFSDGPNFVGGYIGYLSYEANSLFEKLPTHKDPDGLDLLHFDFIDRFFIVDTQNKQVYLVAVSDSYADAQKSIDFLESFYYRAQKFSQNSKCLEDIDLVQENIKSNFSKDGYIKTIKKVQDWIRLGHTYQVNISQRFEFPFTSDPFAVYQNISQYSPVNFAAYFETCEHTIISASPERLFKLSQNRISSRPIAGTRKQTNAQKRQRFIAELKHDPKEASEHAMLVDLCRNDLGRVCEFGSVNIDKFMEIIPYRYVIHTESEISGMLKAKQGFFEIFRALFPGGTITGVPKLRTQEIIHELEPTPRSLYTGSLGYISLNGDMDFNIMIRSILCTKDKTYTYAGGGITYDADATREYQETLSKAKPQILAILSELKGATL